MRWSLPSEVLVGEDLLDGAAQRPPALDAHGVGMARALFEMTGDGGKVHATQPDL